MSIVLDVPAIATMPGGDVMRLIRDILNQEAHRIGSLEEHLVGIGVAERLNLERIAVVRAIEASSDAITLVLAQHDADKARLEEKGGAPKVRRALMRQIADQMRASLLKGVDDGGEA